MTDERKVTYEATPEIVAEIKAAMAEAEKLGPEHRTKTDVLREALRKMKIQAECAQTPGAQP